MTINPNPLIEVAESLNGVSNHSVLGETNFIAQAQHPRFNACFLLPYQRLRLAEFDGDRVRKVRGYFWLLSVIARFHFLWHFVFFLPKGVGR